MNNFRENNIKEILSSWGAKQRQSPANDQVLKAQILAKYSSASLAADSPHRFIPWFALMFAGLAVLIFFVDTTHINPGFYQKASPTIPTLNSESGAATSDSSFKQYPAASPTISDSREFLKKDYSATIRTRTADVLASRIQTVVRGHDGRIDGVNSSDRFGYIGFVIPASQFDSFRAEIKGLVGSKFYTEQTSVQNLLSQKQIIEQNQSLAETTVFQLQSSREQLISSHNKTVASFHSRLSVIAKELVALDAEVTTDPNRQAEITVRKQQLTQEKARIQTQLANENKGYSQNLSSLDSQIQAAQSDLDNIRNQDQNLIDDVATVQGTISLSWIGIWEIIDLYLPGPLISWVLLVTAIVAYMWQRRQLRILVF